MMHWYLASFSLHKGRFSPLPSNAAIFPLNSRFWSTTKATRGAMIHSITALLQHIILHFSKCHPGKISVGQTSAWKHCVLPKCGAIRAALCQLCGCILCVAQPEYLRRHLCWDKNQTDRHLTALLRQRKTGQRSGRWKKRSLVAYLEHILLGEIAQKRCRGLSNRRSCFGLSTKEPFDCWI